MMTLDEYEEGIARVQDPEDLWKLIRVAFVIKGREAGRGLVGKGVPALVRPVLKMIYSQETMAAARSLPVVGKYLLALSRKARFKTFSA